MQVLCKSDWFACLAFGAASPFAGFACGLGFVALRAEDLKVLVVVVVGAALVVDVVDFQVLAVAALSTLVSVTRQDSFTCNGGDVRGVAVSPHWFFSLASENVRHPAAVVALGCVVFSSPSLLPRCWGRGVWVRCSGWCGLVRFVRILW